MAEPTITPWIYREKVKAGPWRGGYYIARNEGAPALAYACKEDDAAFITKASNNHKALVKALKRLEDANEKLAGLRTQEMYLAMLDAGQEFALADLQDARNEATDLLELVGSQKQP